MNKTSKSTSMLVLLFLGFLAKPEAQTILPKETREESQVEFYLLNDSLEYLWVNRYDSLIEEFIDLERSQRCGQLAMPHCYDSLFTLSFIIENLSEIYVTINKDKPCFFLIEKNEGKLCCIYFSKERSGTIMSGSLYVSGFSRFNLSDTDILKRMEELYALILDNTSREIKIQKKLCEERRRKKP